MKSIFLAALFLGFFLSRFGPLCASEAIKLQSDSIYHLRGKWTNQNAESLQFSELAGKPRLIAMVYTKCEATCPLLVQDIKNILKEIPSKNRENLKIDLFSFDSERETQKSLQDFVKRHKIEDPAWSVYFGSKDQVAEVAAALEVQYKKLASGEFIHSNFIFLINEKGQIQTKQSGLGQTENFAKAVIAKLVP